MTRIRSNYETAGDSKLGRLRAWLSDELEPSRLRAVIIAGVGLAAALGLVTTTDLPTWVDPMLVAWGVAAPWVQHLLVRPKVTPVAKVRAALDAAELPQARGLARTADLQAMLITNEVPVEAYPSGRT